MVPALPTPHFFLPSFLRRGHTWTRILPWTNASSSFPLIFPHSHFPQEIACIFSSLLVSSSQRNQTNTTSSLFLVLRIYSFLLLLKDSSFNSTFNRNPSCHLPCFITYTIITYSTSIFLLGIYILSQLNSNYQHIYPGNWTLSVWIWLWK